VDSLDVVLQIIKSQIKLTSW